MREPRTEIEEEEKDHDSQNGISHLFGMPSVSDKQKDSKDAGAQENPEDLCNPGEKSSTTSAKQSKSGQSSSSYRIRSK